MEEVVVALRDFRNCIHPLKPAKPSWGVGVGVRVVCGPIITSSVFRAKYTYLDRPSERSFLADAGGECGDSGSRASDADVGELDSATPLTPLDPNGFIDKLADPAVNLAIAGS